LFFLVRHARQGGFLDTPAVGGVGASLYHRHHRGLPRESHFDGRFANGICLLDVYRRGDVTCRALQVIRHRVMKFVAQVLADHVRNHRGDAAELRMAERIAGAGFGQETAVRVSSTFAEDDDTVAVALDALPDTL